MLNLKQLLVKSGPDRLLFAADIAGTLLFAIEGAASAVNGKLDLIGIIVLAFCTALGGGLVRDILLGALPPAALRDWRYPVIPVVAALLVFFPHRYGAVPSPAVQLLDAAGLAFFAVAGTLKARQHKMNASVAVMLGTITAVGGGTIRDVLLNEVPSVLRIEIYATAALAGSACMLLARQMRLSSNAAAAIGGSVCFLLRMLALWRHWNLPRAFGS